MNNTKKIYILLSNPSTIVAKMIGFYTKAPYNHASIAFDHELREVYSFGRKHPLIPIYGGFVKEDVRCGVFKKASCAVYSRTVSEDTYLHMRNFVQQIEEHGELYNYNFLGILGIILNMEMGRKRSYFCSQFVSQVFQEGGVRLLNKSAGLTTPADFSTCASLKLEFSGSLEAYRKLHRYSPHTAQSVFEPSRLFAAN